jgi:hypothetical protein
MRMASGLTLCWIGFPSTTAGGHAALDVRQRESIRHTPAAWCTLGAGDLSKEVIRGAQRNLRA